MKNELFKRLLNSETYDELYIVSEMIDDALTAGIIDDEEYDFLVEQLEDKGYEEV